MSRPPLASFPREHLAFPPLSRQRTIERFLALSAKKGPFLTYGSAQCAMRISSSGLGLWIEGRERKGREKQQVMIPVSRWPLAHTWAATKFQPKDKIFFFREGGGTMKNDPVWGTVLSCEGLDMEGVKSKIFFSNN